MRTPAENVMLSTLKAALNGDGQALRTVVGEGYGSEVHFYGAGPFDPITVEDTWVEIDSTVIELEGGDYTTDLLTFFTGTEISRSYQVRFLVNGTPTGDTLNKELKDVNDQIEYNTFNNNPGFAPGPVTLSIEAMIPAAGGTPSMTITRWRVRIVKVAQP